MTTDDFCQLMSKILKYDWPINLGTFEVRARAMSCVFWCQYCRYCGKFLSTNKVTVKMVATLYVSFCSSAQWGTQFFTFDESHVKQLQMLFIKLSKSCHLLSQFCQIKTGGLFVSLLVNGVFFHLFVENRVVLLLNKLPKCSYTCAVLSTTTKLFWNCSCLSDSNVKEEKKHQEERNAKIG